MVTFLMLANFTDQGLRTVKDTTRRADAAKELGAKFGVNMKTIYWTMGQYDLVTVCEAEDDASMAAFGFAISAAGNVRGQTLKAFAKDEMNGILSKLG
ncbi:GYD domain-containing protein [Undibacterium sp. Jales W-56]|uniref:GYD domain-containing protein n=1 Tax=Undibacterium sp. Jales W-56 TaxID=2897325 RepID=UPI0021CF122E|nr:GYD domain-containing protein [Undibacterium sp. Jales W-56]MCU6435442.1 GYD domain-containing protein [Undibacterium sp. Jales W-56]